MKMYITMCALTKGVRLMECKASMHDPDYVNPDGWYGYIRVGTEAFAELADAKAKFEKMHAAAIKSAERRLAKLRAMKFEVKS